MKRLFSIGTIFMHADSIDVLLMFVGFLSAVCDGLVTPTKMFLMGRIMNNLGTASTTNSNVFLHNINKNVIFLLYIACVHFIVAFLEGYCWTRTGERQAARMRATYLKAILRQEVGYFDIQVSTTAKVISGISNDSLVIQEVISEKVPNMVMNVTMFLGSYVVAFLLMWRLALVALPFVVLLVIPGIICGRILTGLARKNREEYNKAATIAEQVISSIRTVYSFVGERKTRKDFSIALQRCVEIGLKEGLAKGVAFGSNGTIYAMWAVVSWYGSILVMHDGGKGGTVYSIGACISVGGRALGSGLSNLKYFAEAFDAGEHILEVIQRVSKIDPEDLKGEILESFSGDIEFKNVKFAYPSRPNDLILPDFSLKVPVGKMVALVGGSGSGKSTIIALLERFYDPLKGQILLGGVDIQKLQVKWLRSQMGLVSQEPALFATSIKENILFGKEDATIEEVIVAAKVANAHNFISQLPQGYDTQVGERGVQMSGGQKQRIAIARAIIKAPRILMLDEATSALDSESERVVQEALDVAAVGRTTIVIAHRLSTIRNADVIAVLKNGQVLEMGSHDELMQDMSGLYSSLVQLQQIEKMTTLNLIDYTDKQRSSSSMRNSILIHRSSSSSTSTHNKDVSGAVLKAEEEEEEKTLAVPSLRRLFLLNRPEWTKGSLGCVSALLSGAVHPTYSLVIGGMISVYFLTDHKEIKFQTMKYSLFFASLAVFTFVINVIQQYNFTAMGEYLTKRVRENMFSNILTFEVGWFDEDKNSTGAICSRLADANGVRSLVGDRLALLVQTFSAVTVACTMSMVIAWKLAIVIIAVQPLMIACFYSRRVVLKSMSNKGIKAQDESSNLATEAVSNLRTVTAFSSQARILSMLDKAQQGPQRDNIRQSWFAGICLALSQSLISCVWALDFWYGGRLISHGDITSRAFFQTFMILVSTGRVIADAGAMTTDLAKGADAVTLVFSLLDRVTRIDPDNKDGCKPQKLTGLIEINNVDFAYPTRSDIFVVMGLSLKIEAGTSTALVGQSGSGKSTIIGLIERFYDPVSGTVMIDGRDIKSYNLRSLRKHIGLVSQEPVLFSGTIKQNIEYGGAGTSKKIDEIEIIEAAKAANAHDFIASLRDGYETRCGDRGVMLSGGQKQRIAIARAILKNPSVLLLDEATSALDSQSELVVQEALERLMVRRTVVVVAHRLSTIKNCNLIVVMEKGKVVEKGTHSALLAKGPTGPYHSLVSLQSMPQTLT